MIYKLQYTATRGGSWSDVGTVRRKQKSFEVSAISDLQRDSSLATIGYRVEITVDCLSIPSAFFSAGEYFFRLYKVDDGAYVYFGQKEYIPAFDALLTRNTYGLHTIRLIWNIPVNERYIIITPGGLSKLITADEASLI
jgi:hypothetical protein